MIKNLNSNNPILYIPFRTVFPFCPLKQKLVLKSVMFLFLLLFLRKFDILSFIVAVLDFAPSKLFNIRKP